MAHFIDFQLTGSVAEIILNRPEKRNALSVEMWEALPALIDRADGDDHVAAIILRGGTTFAAGADISEFGTLYATDEGARRGAASIRLALAALETARKPIIAAIEGDCIGGGVSLAMACDYRFASVESRFGVTPARIGLVYPLGDTRRLMAAIGLSQTKRLLFTGQLFDASEAARIGLIDQLVDADTARSEAMEFCSEIATRSQWTIQATKRMLAGLAKGWTEDGVEATALFEESFKNEDFAEGHQAFLDKRQPKFPLR